jgi:hypothetical protein
MVGAKCGTENGDLEDMKHHEGKHDVKKCYTTQFFL